MGDTTNTITKGTAGQAAAQAKALIDTLAREQQTMAAAQARQAAAMMAFSDLRRRLDRRRITDQHSDGVDLRYTAGEFATIEIGLAMTASKHSVARTLGIARRVSQETPDAWDAWRAGHLDHDRARRINKALIRLVKDSSKQLLNALVVDVAVCKTPELLSRWLNEFVARVEPDQTNDRLHRALEDRCVSIRPDLDGMSFLHAALSAADTAAIDRVLTALAAVAAPGATRTLQQRRADVLSELLLGKISNGCHVVWQDDPDPDEDDENEDDDDEDEDEDED